MNILCHLLITPNVFLGKIACMGLSFKCNELKIIGNPQPSIIKSTHVVPYQDLIWVNSRRHDVSRNNWGCDTPLPFGTLWEIYVPLYMPGLSRIYRDHFY